MSTNPPNIDISKIHNDPNFLALPPEEKFKVLNQTDPNFQTLPQEEKEKVIISLNDKADSQQNSDNSQQPPIQGKVEQNVNLNDLGQNFQRGALHTPIEATERLAAPVFNKLFGTHFNQQDTDNVLNNPALNGIIGKQATTQAGQQAQQLGTNIENVARPIAEMGVSSAFNPFASAGFLPTVGNFGTQGAGITAMDQALNGKFDPAEIGKTGLMGAGGGALLGGAGAAFEKLGAPLGGYLSGVDQKSIQRAFEANKAGRSIFDKNVNYDTLKNLGNIVGQKARELDDITSIPYENVQNGIQNILDNYSTSKEINPLADSLKGKINKIQKYLDKYRPQVNEVVTMPDGTTMTREEFNSAFDGMNPEDLNFDSQALQSGGEVPPSVLHDIKQDLYDDISFDKTKGLKRTDRQNEALKQIANYKNQTLRNISPEYAQANDNYSQMARDLQAKLDFAEPLKYKSPYMLARMSAPLFGSFALHNPAVTALEFGTSPKLNQFAIQGYQAGTKLSPFIPRATVAGYNAFKK